MGSIAVGLLMGGIATQLMRNNKKFLIGACCTFARHPVRSMLTPRAGGWCHVRVCAGQAMEPDLEKRIVAHLRNDKMVVQVVDPKSEEMGVSAAATMPHLWLEPCRAGSPCSATAH